VSDKGSSEPLVTQWVSFPFIDIILHEYCPLNGQNFIAADNIS
jgi:hypothetical protein